MRHKLFVFSILQGINLEDKSVHLFTKNSPAIMSLRYYYIIFCLSFGCTTALFSQPLEYDTKSKYQSPDSEYDRLQIGDMLQSINGDLWIVGEAWKNRKRAKAVILEVKKLPNNTEQSTYHNIAPKGVRSSSIHKIVQIEDGSLYALGSVQQKKKTRYTWIVKLAEQIDKQGKREMKVVMDSIYQDVSLGTFDYILPLEYGTLMLVQNNKNGATILKKMDNQGNLYDFPQKQYPDDIVGIVAAEQDHAVLCGKKTRQQPATCVKVNAAGEIIASTSFDEDVMLHSINPSYDNNVVLIGQKNSQTWAAELSPDLKLANEMTFDKAGTHQGFGLVKDVHDQYFLIDGKLTNEVPLLEAQLAKNTNAESLIPLTKDVLSDVFKYKKTLYTYQNEYIIAGNAGEDIELMYFKQAEGEFRTKGAASSYQLEVIDNSITLMDEQGDNKLSPNERGFISFQVKNIGTADIKNAIVNTDTRIDKINICYFEQRYISKIGVGETRTITIPFSGGSQLGTGVSKFNAIFKDHTNTSTLCIAPLEIETEGHASGEVSAVTWRMKKQNGEAIDIRPGSPIRASSGLYNFTANISHNGLLTKENIKVWLNDKLLTDAKSSISLTPSPYVQNTFNLDFNLPLGNLENVKVQIQDKVYQFVLETRQPNLHVLAIAPRSDLKKNDEDLRKFVDLMQQQANRGIFRKVTIDTLVAREKTTKAAIEVAFENLERGFNNAFNIRPMKDDVVIIYYSGHGDVINEDFYLRASNYSDEYKKSTSNKYKNLVDDYLDRMDCHKLVFLDACHSGMVQKQKGNTLSKFFEATKGTITLTSSGEEFSYESEEGSYFTRAIADAFNGVKVGNIELVLDKEGYITINNLYAYIQNHMDYQMKKDGYSSPKPQRYFSEGTTSNGNLGLFKPIQK